MPLEHIAFASFLQHGVPMKYVLNRLLPSATAVAALVGAATVMIIGLMGAGRQAYAFKGFDGMHLDESEEADHAD